MIRDESCESSAPPPDGWSLGVAETPLVASDLGGALVDRAVGAAALVDLVAQRARVADRADLGDVARERQADGPVDDGADLAAMPGIWLMW